MTKDDRHEILEAFLREFPLDYLPKMPIEKYTNLNRSDSFCYWVESKTDGLGSIWGGSSYKFGIYMYRNTPTGNQTGKGHDDTYAWFDRFGNSAEDTYKAIREEVVKIANLANKGRFDEIDQLDTLGPVYKWKVAFLYSNEQLIPIYSRDMLTEAAESLGMEVSEETTIPEMQRFLMDKKGSEDLFQYYDKLLQIIESAKPDETDSTEEPDAPSDSEKHYWWLVANPKIWSLDDAAVGTQIDYHLYNDNGRPRRIRQNFLDAKTGDAVIGYESSPTRKIVALAEVSREQDGETIVFTKKEALRNPVDLETVKSIDSLKEMEYLQNPLGTLFSLTEEQYDQILEIIREDNPFPEVKQVEEYSRERFLEEVYMEPSDYDDLVRLLKVKKNIILQGAPGVGKTFAAKRLAYSILGRKDDNRIEMVQFHQNYSYEDFVMGYKPTADGGFELREGVFYNFCRRAKSDPEGKYFFIIDEINRGNLSKIFGELLMLIENSYRGESIRLAYTDEDFKVPDNIYIIGMMNTADRSLAMIDYALRRRFSFFDMRPAFATVRFKEYQVGLQDETFDKVIDAIVSLNKIIESDDSLGPGFCIGHSYFCNHMREDAEWLPSVIKYDIAPMLREYWFDDPDRSKTEIATLETLVQ